MTDDRAVPRPDPRRRRPNFARRSVTTGWLSIATVGSLGGCFSGDAARGLPCTNDEPCGALECEYGVCGGPTRCDAGAGVGDYCYVITDEVFPVGAFPGALAIADVDNDFVRDIVTADRESRGVSILLGDGTGLFTPHDLGLPQLASAPTALGLGHLDGAGWTDIAIVTEDGSVHAVMIGEAGALASVTPVASAVASASRPTIADFVQDDAGVRDIAVLGGDGVFVARNIDLASFEPGWRQTAVDNPRDMLTIQDAAGDPAFAWVARLADDDISSLSHKGDGTFSSVQSIPVGPGPLSFAIADMNSDDYVDALVVSSTGGLWLTKGKNATRDEWSPPEPIYDLGWVPQSLDVLDLDGDTDLDVVVSGATPDGHADVFLLENDGEGVLAYGGALGLRHASAAALADLDRDGVPEIVITAADEDAVRLARRAKAPPMPGDDGADDDATTGVSAGPGNDDDGNDDGTGTTADDGQLETGIDPTGMEDCPPAFQIGDAEVGLCSPIAVGRHDHLAFAFVDEDFAEDLVAVAVDPYEASSLVAFCRGDDGYGYGYGYGDTNGAVESPLCRSIPLPAAATDIAGGRFFTARDAVAITHASGISVVMDDAPRQTWNLATFGESLTDVRDPIFFDFFEDGEAELVVTSAEGLWIAQTGEMPMPELVFADAGLHGPHGNTASSSTSGAPEILLAQEADDSGSMGALVFLTHDSIANAWGAPVTVFAHPELLGFREYEFVGVFENGFVLAGVVGTDRHLVGAGIFQEEQQIAPIPGFTDVGQLELVNLDFDPFPNDIAFIGRVNEGDRRAHIVLDVLTENTLHVPLTELGEPNDLAFRHVPCPGGPGSGFTVELLVANAFAIDRLRVLSVCR